MHVIPTEWSSIWGAEETRVLVVLSLVIQVVLIFLAPLRKRKANMALNVTLWVSYLLADYVATLALGRILSTRNDSEELAALWAPFMLLHLGGPDAITSYSLADNDLWWRHLLGLVVQAAVAALVFLQSLSNSLLWLPTVFVFIPGIIKFGERTLALRSASFDTLKDRIVSEKTNVDEFNTPANDTSENEDELILEGWRWFKVFKRLMVDVSFSSGILIKSQDRFSEIKTKHALKLVSIELSFLYDILHTKAIFLHSPIGRAFRSLSVISLIAALVIFCHLEKHKNKTDVIITYILFCVGLGLEFCAAVILFLSDWTVVSLLRTKRCKFLADAIVRIVQLILRNGKPRWSSTIGQYNLISFCQRSRDDKISLIIMKKLKIKNAWVNMRETKLSPLPESLEDMLFAESKRRARNVHIYNVLVEARTYRGSQALERHGQLNSLGWSMKKEFDECVILWHVATDICYSKVSPTPNNKGRVASWMVCNYMVYLLTQQASMMQLGYGKVRFEEVCTAVKAKFKDKGKLAATQARELLLNESPSNPTDEGSSLLSDGCRLAREMQELDENIKWLVISEAWMEMLGYAAIHCKSEEHAKALSRGGELLTRFWLLMAQMGVVEEIKIRQFESEFI